MDNYTTTLIGMIEGGSLRENRDEYLLVEAVDHVLDLDAVHDDFTDEYQTGPRYPGAYFCRGVEVIPIPSLEGWKCIVVIHHAHDI